MAALLRRFGVHAAKIATVRGGAGQRRAVLLKGGGALLTGIFCAPELGGTGFKEGNDSIITQFTAQLISVVVTIGWTGIVSFIGYYVADKLVGIRVSADEEREGLDLASHGERGYNY